MEIIVKTTSLTKEYRTQKEGPAVEGLNLEIPAGELFGLVGPDGAGKTTTLRMLSTVLLPTSGQAQMAGFDIKREPEKIRRIIGYMPQNFALYQDLTVLENLHFFAAINSVGAEEGKEVIARMLAFTRLDRFPARKAGNLSGGMKKKLALACAMVHSPKILLLDEPSTGVDPVSRRELWAILGKIVEQGMTIVVSTPYMDEAERCSRIAMLSRGKILACGEPQHLISQLPFEVLELKAKPRKTIRLLLDSLGSELEWRPLGDRMRLMVFKENGSLPKFERHLGDLLKKAQVEVTFIRRAKRTMEDVFVHQVEKERASRV